MVDVGAAFSRQQVVAVYLLHGRPGEGDYTESYARWFESALHCPGQTRVPVRLFDWSGETSHLGRADGAVRLLDELDGLGLSPRDRVLLWGHDDAADVLALVTRLLASDPDRVGRFFRAAEIYYRWPIFGCVDIPVWNHVRQRLESGTMLDRIFLDLVTFGTPGRYGWGLGNRCRRLHIASDGMGETQDTEATPTRSAWRARLADRRLHRFFDSVLRNEESEQREPSCDSGTTLLVDYGRPRPGAEAAWEGANYTRQEWLLFHAEEVAGRFYAARSLKAA